MMIPLKNSRSGFTLPIVSLVTLFAIAAIAIFLTSPQKPKKADVPSDEFSAERAFKHIEHIAHWPNMTGTIENEMVCNYIVNELERIGLEVDVQTTSVEDWNGMPVIANITNVAGRITGTDNTKTVLIVGHYDTQPHTPGAADDGLAVSSMLEAAEIIKNNYELQNDIIFLFTDAEEIGLIGAAAFANEHPWMEDVGFVLNLEARGNKGAVLAFEVSPQNGWIIREFIKGVERPFAASMMYEVYNMLPNNTDFTIFKDKGYSGINLALIEGFVNYHSATDSPENLSLASLQHMGSYLMGVAKHFGNISLFETKDNDLVYFNIIGHLVVYYPSSWSVWIFVAIIGLFILYILFGIGRQQLNLRKVFVGFTYVVGVLIIIGLFVWGVNHLVKIIYPHYKVFYSSNFYNVEYYFLAYAALAVSIFSIATALFVRRIGILNIMVSVFFVFILFSLLLLWKVPTASYLTLVPLFFGLISLNVILFLGIEKDKKPWLYHLILLLGILPHVLVFSPKIKLLFVAFGLDMPFAGTAMLTILLLFALPFIEQVFIKLRHTLGIAALGLTIIFLVIAHAQSSPSEERPLQSNVVYASLNDEGEAFWFSSNLRTDSWNAQFFKQSVVGNASQFYPWRQRAMLKADADFMAFPKPLVEIANESFVDGHRVIEFNLVSQVNPTVIDLIIPIDFEITSLSFNGKDIAKVDGDYHQRIGNYFFRLNNPNLSGDRFRVEYKGKQTLSLSTLEIMLGLPQFDNIKPMPSHVIPSTGFESYITLVANKHEL